MDPRDIVKVLDISHSYVRRIIKTKDTEQLKHLKTPYMIDATKTRGGGRASVLLEKLEKNRRIVEHALFQDERQKKDVPDKIFLIKQIDNVLK